MRAPESFENSPLFEYTLMPAHMNSMFKVEELQELELAGPFNFTRGVKTLKIPGSTLVTPRIYPTALYDLKTDPGQQVALNDTAVEKRMIKLMFDLMEQNDTPVDQFERMGIPEDGDISPQQLSREREERKDKRLTICGENFFFHGNAKNAYRVFYYSANPALRQGIAEMFCAYLKQHHIKEVQEQDVLDFIESAVPGRMKESALFLARLAVKGR